MWIFTQKHCILQLQIKDQKNYSTCLTLLDVIATCISNLKKIGTYFDLQKASDSYEIFLDKLHNDGISDILVQQIILVLVLV